MAFCKILDIFVGFLPIRALKVRKQLTTGTFFNEK